METETFIYKLTNELEEYDNETVNARVEVFLEHGEYLNKIPNEYHNISVEILSEAIFLYCLEIDSYYLFRNKKPNKTTTQPKILLRQDIQALQKARKIIHEKIFYKGMSYSDLSTPAMKEFTKEERKKYNDEYKTTINLYGDTPRVDIIEDAKFDKKIYDTYCTLSDLIYDLKKQEFEIFRREQYYPYKKPTKYEIKEFLEVVNKQFRLKASLNQNQLLANL